ncbi:hypothetical protein ACLI09_08645 [Flavobacterium sp. RHBU_24]|uniref:hypothetical protein n=1 Tax=Flavobacterium sp. RHBU_24 TaxID=3391185 RepID=UPI003984BC98
MSDIGNRLKQFIDSQGFNNTEFGNKIGVKGGAVGEMIGGSRAIGGITLKKIGEEFPDLSLSWLFFGNGQMLLPKNEYGKVHKVEEPIKLYMPEDPGKAMLLRYLDDGDVKQKIRDILNL